MVLAKHHVVWRYCRCCCLQALLEGNNVTDDLGNLLYFLAIGLPTVYTLGYKLEAYGGKHSSRHISHGDIDDGRFSDACRCLRWRVQPLSPWCCSWLSPRDTTWTRTWFHAPDLLYIFARQHISLFRHSLLRLRQIWVILASDRPITASSLWESFNLLGPNWVIYT